MQINWAKVGKKLRTLRDNDFNLRRYACKRVHHANDECSIPCDKCDVYGDMIDNKISQEEMAFVLNVEPSTLANWETGRCNPPLEVVFTFCNICKIKFSDFILDCIICEEEEKFCLK